MKLQAGWSTGPGKGLVRRSGLCSPVGGPVGALTIPLDSAGPLFLCPAVTGRGAA